MTLIQYKIGILIIFCHKPQSDYRTRENLSESSHKCMIFLPLVKILRKYWSKLFQNMISVQVEMINSIIIFNQTKPDNRIR
jgi:hypothetical protein